MYTGITGTASIMTKLHRKPASMSAMTCRISRYEAGQKSLVNGTVTFDRVIRDFRAVLTYEVGYHRTLGQLASTLARIRQAVGSICYQSRSRTGPNGLEPHLISPAHSGRGRHC